MQARRKELHRILKSALRPVYKKLLRLPFLRHAIARVASTLSMEINILAEFVEGGFGEEYGLANQDRARLINQTKCVLPMQNRSLQAALANVTIQRRPANTQ